MGGMKIERYDAAGRFLVESETREGQHHCVDIIHEQCSCEDYQFRNRRCKHLDACREVFLDDILSRIRAMEIQRATPTPTPT
jgi:hypothetical protein